MRGIWRTYLFIAILAVIATGMGYLYFTQRMSPEERAALLRQRVAEQATPTPTAAPAPKIVNFAQLLAVPYDFEESSASQSARLGFIEAHKPGFVTLFGSRVATESATETITDINNLVTTENKPLIAVDHEGGRVQRFNGEGFTTLPSWRRLCDLTSEERQARLATSAAELKSVGVEVVFAPVVDVTASNPILLDRACSGDPEEVGQAATDFVTVFENTKILPVLKHYPGLGSATVDTHNAFTSVLIEDKDAAPFKYVLDSFPDIGVMSAHVGVENQNPDAVCSLSVSCIGQVYDLYPDAVIFTDALEMEAARYNSEAPDNPKSLAVVAVEAINAGNTVLVFGKDVTAQELEEVLFRMKQEYTSNSAFRQKVEIAVKKIDRLRAEYAGIESVSEKE